MATTSRMAAVLISMFLLAHAAAGDPPPPPVTVALSDAHLPTKPGYHVIKAVACLGDKKVPLACGLFLPPAYFKSTARMPIVMTLHTRGNSGADGGGGLVGEGLGLLVATGGPDTRGTGDKPANEMNLPKNAEFIGLVPQCPAGYAWESPPVARILAEFITQVARAGRGDEDRVYLTGFSYGGTSTWEMALQVPDRFAAIVPLDGRATHNPADDVKKLRDVAIYLGVGGEDADFIPETQRMRDALLADQHASIIFRTVPRGNHWCYGSIYNDPEFWTWLFAQRRHVKFASTRPATQAIK